MLGLAFVACAGLMMTSCKKKKGDDLTKEEAFAAFIASDEAIAGLEADIAAEPAIKIIDKMLAKAGNKKFEGEIPHMDRTYYQDFLFFWHDNTTIQPGVGYEMDVNGNLEEGMNLTVNDDGTPIEGGDKNSIVYFPLEDGGEYAYVQYAGQETDPKLSVSASIFYPDLTTQIFSPITCTVDRENKDLGDFTFRFNSTASGGKDFAILYNANATSGVGFGGITIGNGSYLRMFYIVRNMDVTNPIYSYQDVHAQALAGLVGKDKAELRWGDIKLKIDGTTKITKETKIEIFAIQDGKECGIGSLDVVSGVITYKDGGQTGQATSDMPKLYAHLKLIFNL